MTSWFVILMIMLPTGESAFLLDQMPYRSEKACRDNFDLSAYASPHYSVVAGGCIGVRDTRGA